MPVIATALTSLLGIEHPILLAPMGSAPADGSPPPSPTRAVLGDRLRLCECRHHPPRVRRSRQCARRHRLHHLGAGEEPFGTRRRTGRPARGGDAVVRRSAVRRPHQGGRVQSHLPGADAGAGPGGCGGRRGHHHRAGPRRGRPFRNDARHHRPRPGRGRRRRANSGGRRRRHRRRAGLAAALALGAAGVSMGTRFTVCRELLWDRSMQAATIAAGGDQTEQTRVFDVVRGAPWPAIYPGRALRNAFSARWNGSRTHWRRIGRPRRRPIWPRRRTTSRRAWSGRRGRGPGQRNAAPAAQIIERIVAQAAAILRETSQMVQPDRSRRIHPT